jgi:hypothetical protein
MLRTLKRSQAVCDLTAIPGDTPLHPTISVTFSLSSGRETSTIQLEVDSCITVRSLKLQLEPYAYQLYISHVEPIPRSPGAWPSVQRNRNITYYARVSSPVDDSDAGSDYGSEPGSPTYSTSCGKNQFLNAMRLRSHQGQEMEDTKVLFEYGIRQNVELQCCVDCESLKIMQ